MSDKEYKELAKVVKSRQSRKNKPWSQEIEGRYYAEQARRAS